MKDLTSKQISLIKETWQEVAPEMYNMVIYFYNHLYQTDSSLIPTLKTHDLKKEAEKWIITISFLVSVLDNMNNSKKGVQKVVQARVDDNKEIKRRDLIKVKKSFLISMGKTLNKKWNKEVAVAWFTMIQKVEGMMIEKYDTKKKFKFPKFEI